MKPTIGCAAILLAVLMVWNCTNEHNDAALMGVDFEWQPIDKGSSDNPEIRLTGVPEGTVRFLVSLVDLNLNGFEHGSGFVDNDGSGVIGRGAAKGSYGGPDPPFSTVKHTYEITVKAYDETGKVIGIGKKARQFMFSDAN